MILIKNRWLAAFLVIIILISYFLLDIKQVDNTHILQKGTAKIEYVLPQNTSKSIVNLIEQKIYSYWNLVNYNNSEGNYLNLKGNIMYQDDELISISINGDYYLRGAAYPKNVHDVLNIDTITVKEVSLNDFINRFEFNTVDLYNQYIALKRSADKREREIAKYLEPLISKSNIKEVLIKKADTKSYFDGNKLNIIITLPHAIGDYVIFSVDAVKNN